jgi:hypothetical protein
VRVKPLACAIVMFVATLAVSCNSSGNTTIVNQGLDCGLLRSDLVGAWTVNLSAVSPALQSCTGLDTGLDTTVVATDDFPAAYANMDVFGSDGSTSFKLLADRSDIKDDTGISDELTGTVQADSCLAMVRVWDRTDALYFQCIGTLTRSNHTISGACDSAEIDSDANGQLDTSCSLSLGVTFNAAIQ